MILVTWSGLAGMNARFSTRSMLGRRSIEVELVYGVISRRHTVRQLPDHLALQVVPDPLISLASTASARVISASARWKARLDSAP